MILGFAGVILLGALVLMLPIATVQRVWTPFHEALFTSTSAVCVTGLVVQDTGSYWSAFGQTVILLLIQIGGLGVITGAVTFLMLSGRNITLKERSAMQDAISAPAVGGIVRLTRFILKGTFLVELLGALALLPIFCRDYGLRGVWMSVFHSVSAFCNAGFDILGRTDSLYPSLTAYAADIGETIVPNANGGLALRSGTGIWDPLQGYFTGCLFQVTGENLQKVTLSVDRGGLYRSETRKALSNDEVQALWQAEENGELVCSVYGADEGAPMNADVMTALGSDVTVDYDSSASYGFWVPPEELPTASDDMKQDTWDSIATFNGAHLTVEATFLDGKTESRTYTLSTGRLRLDRYENGTWTVLPQLAGDEEAYVYGIYAVSEEESRWFQWPVEGSNTISLSNPFGARWNPGGQGKTVHNGIDIPAERGTPVLAAADGTVTETGFDTERGNYLMIDHGDGLATLYAACSKVDVNEGDPVKAGTPIAAVGSAGRSTGPHLHFEVRQDGVPQNPTAYFDADVRATLRMG